MSDPAEVHHGSIPEEYLSILQKRSFAHLATVGPDGTPHNTPMWVDHDGTDAVLLNTLRGRRKERDLRENPRVAVSVLDPDDPYAYLSVRGEVETTEEGATEHIDELARQYLDVDEYPHHDEEDEPRVIVRVPAEHVIARGRDEAY